MASRGEDGGSDAHLRRDCSVLSMCMMSGEVGLKWYEEVVEVEHIRDR